LQTVITKDGAVKVRQYGQWDGYPDGQGRDILEYLLKGNLEKYQGNLAKITEITPKQSNWLNRQKEWWVRYPHMSRDCGSKIHQMIEDGSVEFVALMDEEEAKKWCEGFYTIDFSAGTFTVEYYEHTRQYNINSLPTIKKYLSEWKKLLKE